MRPILRLFLVLTGIAIIGVLGIQLIPYGRSHANPPVMQEPAWNRPETRALAVRACYECHSNETAWPWYSNIAPVSWLVQRDVDEGREKLNFSEFNRQQREAGEAAETVREGEMPPAIFLPTHPEARLTQAERDTLIAGLVATLGESRGESGRPAR